MASNASTLERGEFLSMLGMAGMFVGTILLGLVIRPFYDANQLQAFGEAGATQVRYVALELTMILVFTAGILLLVRMGAQWIIRYGILAILGLALIYSTVPLAHVVLLDDLGPDPFVDEAISNPNGTRIGAFGTGDALYAELVQTGDEDLPLDVRLHSVTEGDWANGTTSWSVDHTQSPMGDERLPRVASNGVNSGLLSMTNGAYVWTVDESGSITEGLECFEMREEGPIETLPGGCATALMRSDDTYLIDVTDVIWRFVAVEDPDTGATVHRQQAAWSLPPGLDLHQGYLSATQLGDDHLLLVSETMALVVLLEETSDGIFDPIMGGIEEATTFVLMDRSEDEATPITTSTVGVSPWSSSSEDQLLWFGDADGTVRAWQWNSSWTAGSFVELAEEERLHMDDLGGSVLDLVVTDIDDAGGVEVWTLLDDGLHLYAFESLAELLQVEANGATELVVTSIDGAWAVVLFGDDGLRRGEVTTDMFLSSGIEFDGLATTIGLIAGLVMLVLLYVHSEWYVVNAVGVLVGAGVITMLGVTFVPPLLVLFMVAAAVYDAWAVYRSKHMLELADTMIGMRLPILLVAPQKRDYSYIEDSAAYGEGRFTQDGAQDAPSPSPAASSSGGSRDAMFMGLGDVIFPGMLVVSAVQYLGGMEGLVTGMATMLGGLLGYAVLMRAVATGRAQAGLPLLNGGAILGYVVGGLFTVGGALFSFGISL